MTDMLWWSVRIIARTEVEDIFCVSKGLESPLGPNAFVWATITICYKYNYNNIPARLQPPKTFCANITPQGNLHAKM